MSFDGSRIRDQREYNRCHEAIQIYILVEVDAERQIIEKTEFFIGERLLMRQ